MEGSRTDNLAQYKQKILQFINVNGPSLPVRIATKFGTDSLIVSAFLAELLSEKELKISNMRVGNSPLYYIKGQEFQLSEFANYLGSKEREALELLKHNAILEDTKMEPAIRVALRAIKDFAIPIQKGNGIFWKYLKINNERAMELIEGGAVIKKVPKIGPEKVEEVVEEKSVLEEEEEEEEEVEEELEIEEEVEEEVESVEDDVEEESESEKEIIKPIVEIKSQIVKTRAKGKSEFVENVEALLERERFQIVRELASKKREFSAIIRKNDESGIVDYLCLAKDKKSTTDRDLMKFLEAGKNDKLPVFVLATGEPNKRAQDWLEYFGDFFRFRKLE